MTTDSVLNQKRNQVCAISAALPQWLQEVIKSYEHDQVCKDLMAYLALQPDSILDYKYAEGIIRYKENIYNGSSHGIKEQIMEALHSSAFGEHSGQLGSTQRIFSIFYLHMMKQEIFKFVQQCDNCQRNKHENLPYPGLLQPLPIPNKVWTHINMDFVENLHISEGCNVVLVVVDSVKWDTSLSSVIRFLLRM